MRTLRSPYWLPALLCWVLALAFCCTRAVGSAVYLSLQERIVEIFEEKKSSVVKVFAVYSSAEEEGRTLLYVGTGFFVSSQGHLLTNTSATVGADRIWIEIDEIAYAAESVGYDPVTNVALLQVTSPPASAGFVHLDDRDQPAAVGSVVVAITSALGMEPGPGFGLVSGWNTSYGEKILPTIYLRTSIAADGGEGGAPVFDLNGRFVGMIVAGLPEIRSSFVLPARAVRRIQNDILLSGAVEYALFGFQTRQIGTPEVAPHVVVESVVTDSPADNAGVVAGDVLKAVGDFPVQHDRDLRNASFYSRPGQVISIRLLRDGEELTLPMRVGKRTTLPALQPGENPLEVSDAVADAEAPTSSGAVIE